MKNSLFSLWLVAMPITAALVQAQTNPPITFNSNFEGGSLGRIELLSNGVFRCHVEGQHDERGRNRQASWYYFRIDNVRARNITLTLTDFVGEYNDRPGACPMYADTIPVFSKDGKRWQHFRSMDWDDEIKEATLRFRVDSDSMWIAHVPPYTQHDVLRLLDDVSRSEFARIEVIGRSAQGRDLHQVTVTDFATPDAGKRRVWLITRQHAWEAPTSHVAEGALRFLLSDEPQARDLRRTVVFTVIPTMDPDGCATGKVRFNANGYDLNRHWDEVDLRDPQWLRKTPEIWYAKKTILAAAASGGIDLLLNLHNTEHGEYIETSADLPEGVVRFERLFNHLIQESIFDPSTRRTSW